MGCGLTYAVGETIFPVYSTVEAAEAHGLIMDEHERRERAIFAEFLAGTPIEGDAGELDRLMRVDGTLRRMQVVSVIRAGEADNVVRALVALRWRGTFHRDVRGDIDDL